MSMSVISRRIAGILLVSVPTIQFGGHTLLTFLRTGEHGYVDNPLRQDIFRAGHAHAGVWVLLALVAMLYVDRATLGERMRWVARIGFAAAPILAPLGFFLSMLSPEAQRPGGAIALVYAGAACLAVAAVTLGVGLLRAPGEGASRSER